VQACYRRYSDRKWNGERTEERRSGELVDLWGKTSPGLGASKGGKSEVDTELGNMNSSKGHRCTGRVKKPSNRTGRWVGEGEGGFCLNFWQRKRVLVSITTERPGSESGSPAPGTRDNLSQPENKRGGSFPEKRGRADFLLV